MRGKKSNKVYDTIYQRISDGHYQNILPGEFNLKEEFEVSRTTIRRALKTLMDDGVIKPEHGVGWIITGRVGKNFSRSANLKTIACITTKYAQQLDAYSTVFNILNIEAVKSRTKTVILYEDVQDGLDKVKEYFNHETINGIIFIGIRNMRNIQEILQLNIPVIFLNSYLPELSDCVIDDSFAGGYLAGQHLINNGHRNVLATFDAHFPDPAFKERIEGFKKACGNIRANVKLIKIRDIEKDGKDTAALFKGKNRATAIFTISDTYYDKIKALFANNKLDIPEDVSVVCYDENPDIDCIKQRWETVAEKAFKRIIEKIDNANEVPYTEKILPELIIKGSVKNIS